MTSDVTILSATFLIAEADHQRRAPATRDDAAMATFLAASSVRASIANTIRSPDVPTVSASSRDRRASDRLMSDGPARHGAARRRSGRPRQRSPQALRRPTPIARDAVRGGGRRHPRCSRRGPRSATSAATTIERYAAYRVGYHRGLDALRANGWRGSGYVRWSAPTNRGFLRSLPGCGAMAAAIGEPDEAERFALFLAQLDPSGVPAE